MKPVPRFSVLRDAFRLAHDRYVERELMEPHPSGLRFSVYELLPASVTMVTLSGDRVTGTLSIIPDSPAGLPSGYIYPEYLQTLRGAGRRVAEITMFSAESSSGEMERGVSARLMQAVCRWCMHESVDDLWIVVNPRHVPFYVGLLGFEAQGQPRRCPHVRGAPGVLLTNDVRALREGRRPMPPNARRLFAVETSGPSHRPCCYRPTSDELLSLFRARPDVLESLSPGQADLLLAAYPALGTLFGALQGSRKNVSELVSANS